MQFLSVLKGHEQFPPCKAISAFRAVKVRPEFRVQSIEPRFQRPRFVLSYDIRSGRGSFLIVRGSENNRVVPETDIQAFQFAPAVHKGQAKSCQPVILAAGDRPFHFRAMGAVSASPVQCRVIRLFCRFRVFRIRREKIALQFRFHTERASFSLHCQASCVRIFIYYKRAERNVPPSHCLFSCQSLNLIFISSFPTIISFTKALTSCRAVSLSANSSSSEGVNPAGF